MTGVGRNDYTITFCSNTGIGAAVVEVNIIITLSARMVFILYARFFFLASIALSKPNQYSSRRNGIFFTVCDSSVANGERIVLE